MKLPLPVFFFVVFFCCFLLKVKSQNTDADTLTVTDLRPVTVTAFRLESSDLTTPLALSNVGEFRLQNGQQQLALDESLSAVPGVFVQNASNFAQDIRVSIRGFGSRSAFGIRGVKILVDGFPETSPDGQGQVDNIDPASITALQVIRGSTAGLYGNASGGQINFSTLKFTEKNFAEAAATFGSFGLQKYQLRGGGKMGKVFQSFTGTYTGLDGYRDHSGMKNMLLNAGFLIPVDSTLELMVSANFTYSPEAQDAGALTLTEVEANRSAARQRNVIFDAGESLWQRRTGVALTKRFSNNRQLNARLFNTQRHFSTKLPVSPAEMVELERNFNGMNVNFRQAGQWFNLPWEANLGIEIERQHDERKRFENLEGVQGNLLLNQTENFSTAGTYLSQKISLTHRLEFFPGVRLDAMWLDVDDHFLADGNDSGKKSYLVFNPLFGLSYRVSAPLNLYVNAGSGFETPTFTEFANPDGGGFNEMLQPQKSKNVEIGAKGTLRRNRLKYEIAAFYIRLADELIPFDDEIQNRTFYRNAGRSARSGLEFGLGSYLGKGFYLYTNYTLTNFRFKTYQIGQEDLRGKFLPGVPRHLVFAELRYFKTSGFHFTQTVQFVSPLYADDVNQTKTAAYVVANFRAGYRRQFDQWAIEPFFGINNLLDTHYFSNVRINGFGGRYYEPAPGIHFFGGIKAGI